MNTKSMRRITADLGIVLVGIDRWEDITLPAIESVLKYEPTARLVVVDNASNTPYPEMKGVRMRRLDERACYSAAINFGFGALDKVNWYLSMNNDIIVEAPLMPVIEQLDTNAVYSRQIIQEKGVTWFGNWLFLVHNSVWKKVGKFDEGFQMCGFEDADYAIRAAKLNIPTKHVPLRVHHLWGTTRWQLPNYPAVRQANIQYLKSKHGLALGEHVKVVAS